MKALLTILFISFISRQGNEISMHGIKINSSKSVLQKVDLKIDVSAENMTKYKTTNGNDLSVTTENGKVVYLENDWLHEKQGEKPLISNFIFGKTSLREIRKEFGTNGFTYPGRNDLITDTDIIEFNCFDLDSPNKEVIVMITKAHLKENLSEANLADHLKLEAIVLANKKYLNEIWGNKKVFDPNYKKIKL